MAKSMDLAPVPVSDANARQVKPGVWVVLIVIVVVIAALAGKAAHSNGSSATSYSAQSGVVAYNQPLTLTLKSFVDPATADGGGTTDGNTDDHFAVVNVNATNDGNSTLPSSIPVTITAFGSDGQAYNGQTETINGDTLCNVGEDVPLAPSETLNYCEGYVLPNSVTVTRVEVSGNQGRGSGTVSWDVNDTFPDWSN